MMDGEEESMMVALKEYYGEMEDTEHAVDFDLNRDQIRSRHNITFNPEQDTWTTWKEPHGDEQREDDVDI
jgi:hypothetical protein